MQTQHQELSRNGPWKRHSSHDRLKLEKRKNAEDAILDYGQYLNFSETE